MLKLNKMHYVHRQNIYHLNTSYVKVKPELKQLMQKTRLYLNTSYVKVKLNEVECNIYSKDKFKYILC